MFEGKHADIHAGVRLGRGPGGLRALSWPELVAQLDAAREFRSAFGSGEAGGHASFDANSARHIAGLGEGKPNFNLDDLANGKPAVAISRSATNGAARDDRESK